MAIFGLFKQLLLGQHPTSSNGGSLSSASHRRRRLPSTVAQNGASPIGEGGEWRTLGEIGEGAFGKIEKVCSVERPQLIAACKSISLQEGEEIDDFLVEIEILALCKGQPNIVELIACYFHEQKLFMMLEYCAGGAVDSIMVELNKPLNEPQIAHVTCAVCSAVEFLHSRAIIHRDIKAGNVLLTGDGAVKLADFGVSAIMKNNERRDSFIGTPYWMAPEVIICETFKDQPYDCRADIWSLGITCIEMAQMEPPNHNMNPMRVVIKVQKSEPPTLAQPHKWTPEFSDFLRKCLVKNVDGRWSAVQLLSHPFLRSADDRRPIVQLLCEKNAEVVDEEEEEVVEAESGTTTDVDDADSVKIALNFHHSHHQQQQQSNNNNGINHSSSNNNRSHDHHHNEEEEEHEEDTYRPQEEAIQILDDLYMALEEDGVGQQRLRDCCSSATSNGSQHQLVGSSAASTVSTGANVINAGTSKNDDSSAVVGTVPTTVSVSCAGDVIASTTAAPSVKSVRGVAAAAQQQKKVIAEHSREPSASVMTIASTSSSSSSEVTTKRNKMPFSTKQFEAPQPPSAADAATHQQKRHSKPAQIPPDQRPEEPIQIQIPDDELLRMALEGDEMARQQQQQRRRHTTSNGSRLSSSTRSSSMSSSNSAANYNNTKSSDDKKGMVTNKRGNGILPTTVSVSSTTTVSVQQSTVLSAMPNGAGGGELLQKQQQQPQAAINANDISSGDSSNTSAASTVDHHSSSSARANDSLTKNHIPINAITSSKRSLTSVDENDDDFQQQNIIFSDDSVTFLPPSSSQVQNAERAPSAASLMAIASTSASSSSSSSTNAAVARQNNANGAHGHHQLSWMKRAAEIAHHQSSFDQQQQQPLEPFDLPPPEPPVDYDCDATPRAVVPPPPAAVAVLARHMAEPAQFDATPKSNSNRVQQQQQQSLPLTAAAAVVRPPYQKQQQQHPLKQKRPHPSAEDVQQAPPQLRKSPHRATVTKRTRTYVIDGVEVTSTSMHVLGAQQDFELRKRELRDLKRMQREEARQQQELNSRAEQVREHQERKFVFEKQAVQRTYEAEIEAVSRTQKKKMEETERHQEEEMRALAKRIRVEQERDLGVFRERLRQEQKIMKQEVDMLPKAQRKSVFRQRKDQLERRHCEKESDFVDQQMRSQEVFLLRARDRHREKLCLLEKQFLEQKHQLERSMETALWELEEAQLAEKHALLTQQFRDVFHLQRTHMLARHAKEQEHVRRINQSKEEQLLRALTADRKALPKVLRNEAKTRTMMFRKSLEVDLPGESDTWTAKVRMFEEREKQRMRLKMEEYDQKCKRKLAQLVERNQEVMRELEEIHNEKRNILLENERAKLAEYEQEYQQLLAEWKASLPARKATLETKFADELATQERFYGADGGTTAAAAAMSSSTSTSSSSNGGGGICPPAVPQHQQFSLSGGSHQRHL
ncbi:hypothetical protein niasHS_017163 [Heterodera schachtii]|uniref:Protein kinase domain-containing protein n=1 Tax=Heterodera schachtii TaxID=97005 RepID=A0ABD2I2V2_HETSC